MAVKAEDSEINFSSSSSSSRSSRNSSSLGNQGSSNISSDSLAVVEHISTEVHGHTTHTGVIREYVIGEEGRGISTQNAGQQSSMPLTSQLIRVPISSTTTISLPLYFRTCNMDRHH